MSTATSVRDTFAERLIALRRQHGISQVALASALHLVPASISSYERKLCEPNIGTALLIAKFFGVSIAYLVGEESTAGHVSEDLSAGVLESKQHSMELSFMRTMREAIKTWEDTYCG